MQKRLRSGGAFLHARLGLDSSRLFAAQNDVEAESSENACFLITEAPQSSLEKE